MLYRLEDGRNSVLFFYAFGVVEDWYIIQSWATVVEHEQSMSGVQGKYNLPMKLAQWSIGGAQVEENMQKTWKKWVKMEEKWQKNGRGKYNLPLDHFKILY